MIKSKYISIITIVVITIILIFTCIFTYKGEDIGIVKSSSDPLYVSKIFDDSKVHTIDIVINDNDWEDLIENATNEQYYSCTVVIDGEKFSNVGIRAKGNTSLSQIASDPDTDRYSFKIQFDEYEEGKTCYGLDKLALNNIMSDSTYMKDYLSYKLMNYIEVATPLTSYMSVSINGQAWGLYLGVEAIEDSFLTRNYGNDVGELYKPDSMDMGDRPDNENIDDSMKQQFEENMQNGQIPQMPNINNEEINKNETGNIPTMGQRTRRNMKTTNETQLSSENTDNTDNTQTAPFNVLENNMGEFGDKGGFGGRGGGVDLVYIDDKIDSYSAIFDSAKTDVTDTDKQRLIESIKKLNNGQELESVVDVEQVLRYFAVHNFVLNFDSYTGSMKHNYYLYEKDGKLTMLPWDYNLAFGGFGNGEKGGGDMQTGATLLINYPIDTPVSGASMEDRPILNELLQVEEYKQMYHNYLSELITIYFNSGLFEKEIDETYNLIKNYVKEDVTAFYTYDEFEKGYQTLKEFCLLRAQSVEKQLNGEIPTTTDGQNEDKTNFVDASNINTNDMGSQGGGGKDGKQMQGFGDMETFKQNFGKTNQLPENINQEIGSNSEQVEELTGEVTENTQTGNQQNNINQIISIVIVPTVVLVIAIIFVMLFKKKK